MRTTNYTELRNNLKGYLDTVINDCDPLIVHRPKDTSVVIIPLEEYNSIVETLYIMSSPENMRRIREAEADIEAGRLRMVNVDEL